MRVTKYNELVGSLSRWKFDNQGRLIVDPDGDWVSFTDWEAMRAELWNVANAVDGPDKCLLEDVAIANREADKWKLRALDAETKLAQVLEAEPRGPKTAGAAAEPPNPKAFALLVVAAYNIGFENGKGSR